MPALAAATMESAAVDTAVKGHKVITGGGIDSYALTLPVILEAGKGISAEIQKSPKGQGFIDQMIPKMRQALYADLACVSQASTCVPTPPSWIKTNTRST